MVLGAGLRIHFFFADPDPYPDPAGSKYMDPDPAPQKFIKMTIFCLKNVGPDPQKNADPAQKQSIFSENGPFFSRIRIQIQNPGSAKENADPDGSGSATLTRRVVNIRKGNQIIRRTPPLFPIEMWNVHQATMIKDPRTNNIAEGGNNRYKELIGHHHPSIWKSIDALQLEEKDVCLTLAKFNIGEMPAVRVSRQTKTHQK